LNKQKNCRWNFLRFKKGIWLFSVKHKILLNKLQFYGIVDKFQDFIISYR
jgi:hypothetical protein